MCKVEESRGQKDHECKKARVNTLAHTLRDTATHDLSALDSNTSKEETLKPGEAKLVTSLAFFLPIQFLFNFLNLLTI